jgi:ribA/ribD-fused uncharacterized protein
MAKLTTPKRAARLQKPRPRELHQPDSRRVSVQWFSLRVDGKWQHSWLSNFYVEPDGSSVEHEFQAAKHAGHPWRQAVILRAATPGKAKRLGRKYLLSHEEKQDWEDRRFAVMSDLIRRKVADWGFIAQQLLFTSFGELIEENEWHDNLWGNCICDRCKVIDGQNWLGKIWMEVREELAAQAHS